MKALTIVVLMGLGYGLLRFTGGLIKELAEFAAEAWHNGEAEQ